MPAPPLQALDALLKHVEPIRSEDLQLPAAQDLAGRITAADVRLDRDSPACDVSAMDGFVVRLHECRSENLPIVGECPIGSPPELLEQGAARRIYTGGPIPQGADTVIRLERATEQDGRLTLRAGVELQVGADIRRRGENAAAGELVLPSGEVLTAAALGALASVGQESVALYRSLRVAVITTGNELDHGSAELPPWRLRDSNGPALVGMLRPIPWISEVAWSHAADQLSAIARAIEAESDRSDAVVLTGGVSKGAYDFVPDAVRQAGGEQVFHRVAARPGQPTLAAVCQGKPILGLPGNPLSVLCAGRRLLVPALRRRAGFAAPDPPVPSVVLSEPSTKSLPITWWRPVKLVENGVGQFVRLTGSGDVIGPAGSDGFVEVPPETTGVGPFPFYNWQP